MLKFVYPRSVMHVSVVAYLPLICNLHQPMQVKTFVLKEATHFDYD